jgi:DNA-binding beta-propeller fold protein YncE
MNRYVEAAVAIVLLLTAGALPAAAGQPRTKKPPTAQPPARQVVWPLPPEQPRIRYLATYHGADDFKTKKTGRWKSLLFGAESLGLKPSDALVKPYGVAVSSTGQVYVTDTAARRVFVFDPDAKIVSFVGESGGGRLTKPIGVAVDDEDQVYVADGTLLRVFRYAPTGEVTMAIGRDGEFSNPSGLAIDRTRHRLYVADAGKHQIFCYSTTDGSLLRTIGRRGSEPGEFNFPTNLFVDQQGRLYVADTMNFRIQIFDADWTPVQSFGVQGDTPGTFNRPKGVSVDSERHIYVADTSFNNFQIFDETGQLLLFVGTGGSSTGEFLLPAGMYIDERDRIYVADQGNGRVQVFQFVRDPAARP